MDHYLLLKLNYQLKIIRSEISYTEALKDKKYNALYRELLSINQDRLKIEKELKRDSFVSQEEKLENVNKRIEEDLIIIKNSITMLNQMKHKITIMTQMQSKMYRNLKHIKTIYTSFIKCMMYSTFSNEAHNDINNTSNSILSGAYPKACGTAVSGYIAKQLLAQLQTECLDAKGTDCGSKNTINFVLTDDAKVDYRYIVDNGKLVLLTKENRSKYTGKMIHMRSPMCCLGKKICNICGGEQYYIQQIENIGLMGVKLSGALTNGNMKKFHSNLIKSTSIDPKTMIM